MNVQLTAAKLNRLRAKQNAPRNEAQAAVRKAKRAANQRKADERLKRLLTAVESWIGRILFVNPDSAIPPMPNVAIKEYRFSARRWKFDLAFPYVKIAIEVSGGTYSVTGRDRAAECERMNEAQIAGWIVLEFSSEQIDDRAEWCADAVRRAFERSDPLNATIDPKRNDVQSGYEATIKAADKMRDELREVKNGNYRRIEIDAALNAYADSTDVARYGVSMKEKAKP